MDGQGHMYDYPLTILTPTFNRAETLPKLFQSLNSQTCKSFQWLIVDDGSEDDTADLVLGFETAGYRLDYLKKDNGGKHTALNYAHSHIRGEWVCIVDSDDWLLSESVEIMVNDCAKYSSDKAVGCLSYQRGGVCGEALVDWPSKEPIVSNHLSFRINGHRPGDCCEVVKTEAFRRFPLPEFERERFLSEGWLWNNIAAYYDTVYISKVLYLCEYLEGGLTKSGRALRLSCPQGGMANCLSFFVKRGDVRVKIKIRVKEMLLFVCYGKCAKLPLGTLMKKSGHRLLFAVCCLPGILLYGYWSRKYLAS